MLGSFDMNKRYLCWIASVLFLCFLAVGFILAEHKPLWVDEVYSQHGIETLSYRQILSGKINEGNNFPLFYGIQKVVCDLARYKPGTLAPEAEVDDRKALLLLRLAPNVCMSLFFAAIFYFFGRYYSLGAGCWALVVALLSPSIDLWSYWAEARPYALWLLLTAAQVYCYLLVVRFERDRSDLWKWLAVVHALLSLTVVFGVMQAVVASGLLWLFKEKRLSQYLWLTAFPVVTGLFYYLGAPKYHFWFADGGPCQLLLTCVPAEYFLIGAVGAVFLVFSHAAGKRPAKEADGGRGLAYAFFLLMFLPAFVVLGLFQMSQVTDHQQGFEISHRYLIYLTAVSIIAINVCCLDVFRALKDRPWLRLNVLVVVTGLLLISFLKYSIWALWTF